jgi:hypothetical protein
MDAAGSGQTRLTSTAGPEYGPAFSPDGTRIVFAGGTFPPDLWLMQADGTGQTRLTSTSVSESAPDWQPTQPVIDPYVRPQGATPFSVSLVPAYQVCTPATINRTHGESLAFPSCDPPVMESPSVTVGTPEVNSADANASGRVRLKIQAGDVLLDGSISDVRCVGATVACGMANAFDGPDYTGELQANVILRMTDRLNSASGGSGREGATVVDIPLAIPLACANTVGTAEGGSCAITAASVNALIPGAVKDGQRAVWELGQAYVTDGGPDGETGTVPNTIFMRQGLFVP